MAGSTVSNSKRRVVGVIARFVRRITPRARNTSIPTSTHHELAHPEDADRRDHYRNDQSPVGVVHSQLADNDQHRNKANGRSRSTFGRSTVDVGYFDHTDFGASRLPCKHGSVRGCQRATVLARVVPGDFVEVRDLRDVTPGGRRSRCLPLLLSRAILVNGVRGIATRGGGGSLRTGGELLAEHDSIQGYTLDVHRPEHHHDKR